MTIQSIEDIGNLLRRKEEASPEEQLEVMRIISEVEQAGLEIIQTKSQQDLAVVLSIMQALLQLQLMKDGNFEGWITLTQDENLFDDVAIAHLKSVLGIASLYEWR